MSLFSRTSIAREPKWSRRSFLAAAATATAALVAAPLHAAQPSRRKTIALIGTEVRTHSHAQHFLDRFLLGYTWGGVWRKPDVDLVSLYIDQFPEKDLARGRSKRYGIPIHKSIAEALTLGTGKLAVSVALSDPARVGSFVTPGSFLTIFATHPLAPTGGQLSSEAGQATNVLLDNIQVIGIGNTPLQSGTTPTAPAEGWWIGVDT